MNRENQLGPMAAHNERNVGGEFVCGQRSGAVVFSG